MRDGTKLLVCRYEGRLYFPKEMQEQKANILCRKELEELAITTVLHYVTEKNHGSSGTWNWASLKIKCEPFPFAWKMYFPDIFMLKVWNQFRNHLWSLKILFWWKRLMVRILIRIRPPEQRRHSSKKKNSQKFTKNFWKIFKTPIIFPKDLNP